MKVPMGKIERIVLSVRRPLVGSQGIADLLARSTGTQTIVAEF